MKKLIFALAAALPGLLAAAPVPDGTTDVFPIRPTRPVEFSTTEGTRINPDVAPDGKTIVFDLLGDLYALDIAGGQARALSNGSAVDFRPRFSPDGTKIAFVSDRNGTDNLWVMNADGSGAYMISSQDPAQRPKDTRFFITPTWTPDGRFVCASVVSELTFYGSDDIRLYPVDPAQQGKWESVTKVAPPDPESRPVFTAQRGAFDREGVDPAFSADGRYLYYSIRTGLNRFNDDKLMPQYQLGRFDRVTEQLHTLTSTPQGAFTPRLSPDGRWMVYAVRYDGDTGLRVRDLRDGSDKWLLFPVDRDAVENWWTEGLVNAYSFLPDSASIVTSYSGKLWRVTVPGGAVSPIPFSAEVRAQLAPLHRARQHVPDSPTVTVRHITDHVLSPDGRQLAFRAVGRVWVKAWPDGVPQRVTRDQDGLDDEGRPSWSADGRTILFTGFSMKAGKGGVYEAAVPPRRAALKALTSSHAYYSSAVVTPDGKAVLAVRSPVTRDSLYTGFGGKEAELVRLSRRGGEGAVIVPISVGGSAPELQFLAGNSQRVFYFDDSATLVSIGLDGKDRHEHLRLQGFGIYAAGKTSGVGALHSQLNAQGTAIILQDDSLALGQVDWLDLSELRLGRPDAPEKVFIAGPYGDLKGEAFRHLSTAAGGSYPFWSADHREIFFSIADQVFRTTPDAKSPPDAPVTKIGLTLPRHQAKGVVAFRGARILTMKGETDIERGDIVVENGRIKAVGAAGTVTIPEGAHVIDATGKTIMPGLVSSHSHHPEMNEYGPLSALGWSLNTKLAWGITTLLDPAPPIAIYTYSDLTDAGGFRGPRLLQTGPITSWTEPLYKASDAATLVHRNRLYEDCCVKVYDVGGRLNAQWMWSAADAAGLIPVPETEGSFNVSLSYVLDGVAHLAHGLQMPVYDDVRQLFGRSGSSIGYQFTTLVGNGGPSALFYFFNHELDENNARVKQWMPYEYFQQVNRRRLTIPDIEYVFRLYGENLARVMDAGMPVHLGEHGVAHGLANHWNIWAMANGGGNRHALQAATIHSAYAMGIEQEVGSIEPGKLADLLVLDGNPLEDIRATERLHYVMKGGELFDPMTLARLWPTADPGPLRWWASDTPQLRPNAQPSGGVKPW